MLKSCNKISFVFQKEIKKKKEGKIGDFIIKYTAIHMVSLERYTVL